MLGLSNVRSHFVLTSVCCDRSSQLPDIVDPFTVRTIMMYNFTIKPLKLFTLLVALFKDYLYVMFSKMTQLKLTHYYRMELLAALLNEDTYIMFGYMTKATLTHYFRITFFSSDGPTLSVNMEQPTASTFRVVSFILMMKATILQNVATHTRLYMVLYPRKWFLYQDQCDNFIP